MTHTKASALAPTFPSSSPDAAFAAEIVVETRATLAVMPTGAWRRSLRERLEGIEGMLDSWCETRPDEDERRRVTTHALRFFCDVKGPLPAASGTCATAADTVDAGK